MADDELDESLFWSDDDELAAVPREFSEDVFDAVAEAMGPVDEVEGHEDQKTVQEVLPTEEPSASDSQAALLVAVAEAVADDGVAAAAGDPELPMASLSLADRGLQSCTRDQLGYIRSSATPFSGVVGRITVWPLLLPPAKQSVGCRCFLHPRCSLTKTRTSVSDDALLRWLF